MILGQTEALQELARIWEDGAKSMRRYDPEDPKARVLATCAEDVRRVLGSHSPEWVAIGQVQEWTGWSRQTLRKRCQNVLEPLQQARKGPGGEWEVQLSVALDWPRRDGGQALDEVTDLAELARLAGREQG